MKKYLLIRFIILQPIVYNLFTCQNLWASSKSECNSFFNLTLAKSEYDKTYNQEIKFVREIPISEKEATLWESEIRSVIDVVNKKINPLVFPDEVKIVMNSRVGLWAEHQYSSLKLPLRFGIKTNNGTIYTKHPNYMKPIVMHEYGHSLFETNMSLRLPEYDFLTKHLKREEKLNDLMREINKLKYDSANEDLIQKLKVEVAHLEDEILNFLKTHPKSLVIRNIHNSYNELFADLVAVTSLNDPRAIFESINFVFLRSKDKDLEMNLINRNFSTRIQLNRWVPTNKPHDLFGPARVAIWSHFKSRPEFQHRPGIFLYRVLDAMAKHMQLVLNDDQLFSDPKLMNATLIDMINKIFTS